MPIPQTGLKTAEILIIGSAAAKGAGIVPTYNVFHFRRLATAIAPDKLAIEAAFQVAIGDLLTAALNESWTYVSNNVRFIEDVTDPYGTFANGDTGAITGNRLPPDNTAYLYFKSALRGKAYQGSKMISPLSESDTDAATADIWNAAAQTRLDNLAAAILGGFTDSTTNVWVPVVWSKSKSNMAVVPADTFTSDVISIAARRSIGRLKRRQPAYTY